MIKRIIHCDGAGCDAATILIHNGEPGKFITGWKRAHILVTGGDGGRDGSVEQSYDLCPNCNLTLSV